MRSTLALLLAFCGGILLALPTSAQIGGFSQWCNASPTTVNLTYCWGVGADGQLGNEDNSQNLSSPVIVRGIPGGFSDWTDISSGFIHTCGIRAGRAYCWGNSLDGQLGNGTTFPDQITPSLVLGGFTDWTDIAAASQHTCGIRAGQAYCWGLSLWGQLGNGTMAPDRTSPSLVLGGFSDWTEVTTGFIHSCGLRAGLAYCWGNAQDGRLGNGTMTPDRTTPSLVQGGFTDWSRLSAGFIHTCGIRAGRAYCWGYALNGRLGNGTTTPDRTTPSIVSGGFTDWTDIAAGSDHTCGIRAGRIYCWGLAASGRLGNGTTTPDRTTPSIVSGGFTDWTSVTVGAAHTCGIRGGQTYCWGLADNGVLGNGTTTPNPTTPSLVLNNVPLIRASGGGGHTCGIASQTITTGC